MTLKQGRIGSIPDAIQYDDSEYNSSIEVDDPVRVNAEPVHSNDVLRKADLGSLIFPVGSIYLSVLSTNPNSLLGFGTWVRIAEGQFLVGQKDSDPDFSTAENSGGSKTHTHNVDIPLTTSSVNDLMESVDNNLDGSSTSVASDGHTHDINPAAVTSTANNNLPPYFTIYAWKRVS